MERLEQQAINYEPVGDVHDLGDVFCRLVAPTGRPFKYPTPAQSVALWELIKAITTPEEDAQ